MESFSHKVLDKIEWYVTLRSPKDIWTNHPSFLVCEILFYVGGILTFCHARRHGGRYMYLWLSILLHGFVVEFVSYVVPEIDNFWHAQSSVMLIGQRLPLHIVALYPVFLYTASVAVSRLHLSWRSEPFAVGMSVVIFDLPFDLLGVKHLWWSWHDTDPNLSDRNLHVPWTSYYFHASFAAALTFIIHGTRKIIVGTEKYEAGSKLKEVLCVLMTGVLSMPLGCLLFIPFYHPLHDLWNVHTETIVLVYLAIYALIFWSADRKSDTASRLGRWFVLDEIVILVTAHYVTLLLIFVTSKPESIISEGLHQQVGPCDKTLPFHSPVGVVLYKQQYLCLANYDEPYFDFHCLDEKHHPVDGTYWYKICGTVYQNFAEHALAMFGSCVAGLLYFYQLLVASGPSPKVGANKVKSL